MSNPKTEHTGSTALLGASAEIMKADYESRKCEAQQQLKRLESKHKNVDAALEVENSNHG
jgi:hypothetical protein